MPPLLFAAAVAVADVTVTAAAAVAATAAACKSEYYYNSSVLISLFQFLYEQKGIMYTHIQPKLKNQK